MSFFKTKLRKTDKLFSRIIRTGDDWKCQACLELKHYSKDYRNNPQGLHCSHYFSRGKENTRFDYDNCTSLCLYHHQLWGHGDGKDKDYKNYMIKRLGEDGLLLLEWKSNQYCKRDDFLKMIELESKIKELRG